MALFSVDSLVMCYSNVEVAKRWWIGQFECRKMQVPANWDDPLPSDVALRLPGDDEPTILLCDQREVQEAGFERANQHPLLFSPRLTNAREHLISKGSAPGEIQDAGGKHFFVVRDPEGNLIEICEE
jgi:catechol 2,3-dioxygenase-like lactoylglutathione lyase family enzyme